MATYKTIKYIVPVEVVEHTDSINTLADVDTSTAAPTEGQTIKWDGTNWVPGDIEESASGTQKAIFGFGFISGDSNVTNIVSSTGVVATDTTGVGTAREYLSAAGYGGDKAIFGPGDANAHVTNLVSNTGVVATDTAGVGTNKYSGAAAGYGGDKAIFGYGFAYSGYTYFNITSLVSNAGVMSSDTTGVGTARQGLAAAGYGGDKAIFGFGETNGANYKNMTNLVSNSGVVASDTTGVGTARSRLAAAGYGGDKALFGYGEAGGAGAVSLSMTNLVSNTGVVSSDVTGVGLVRRNLAAAGYGGDKAIFGFGYAEVDYSYTYYNHTNLVSNTGVVSSDVTGVGSARQDLGAAGFSTTA
jgi:hypothetical protein